MASDNLDDLFRQQLGGHATPPGPDLQRRLAELAEAERLDALFRTGLGSHASQPRRELWERLEDEYLHPQPQRRRRVVAWWQLTAAAVLLLTLLAGGLWRGGYLGQSGTGLAQGPLPQRPAGPRAGSAADGAPASLPLPTAPAVAQSTAEAALAQATIATDRIATDKKNQKSFSAQATPATASSSSHPIATATRPRRPAPALPETSRHRQQRQQPAADASQLVSTGRRTSPASQPFPTSPSPESPTSADRPHPALVAAMTSEPEVVEVEVRRGPEPSRLAPAAVVAAAELAPARRPRLRLGGLLRQADHLVHGEPVSLAEATGLPESLTVQGRLGRRTVSRTIQL